jgi:TIR domain
VSYRDVITTMHGLIKDESDTYDVCLSFADEQRPYVDEVARLLEKSGVRVFYDAFETANLWGRDLYEYLTEIYSRRSRFCVLFASADYFRKAWTNHERAAAQERALRSEDVYVLPVRFDETRIPGLLSSVGHVDATRTSPAELVTHLLDKLGQGDRHVGVAATVLAVVARDRSVDCVAGLRAVLDAHCHDAKIDCRSHADGVAVAVVPVTVMKPLAALDTLVPALEHAVSRPGARARIVLHRGQIPRDPEQSSVDVTSTVAAARVLAGTEPADCVVAISSRVYAELVRSGSGGVVASSFRKAEAPGQISWDLYLRAESVAGEPAESNAQVSNTVQHLNADNVVFGIQVNKN